MKNRALKTIIILIALSVHSCNDPQTVVTNVVHPDGSITRKIEIRNTENNFYMSDLQVPFDSTWTIKDSVEINVNGDTVWIKRAEKLFRNVAEINGSYKADSGANKGVSRKAEFIKSFRWFNTGYVFAEIIDPKMTDGYPVSDFLNKEELDFFYSPQSITGAKLQGPDSLRYRAFKDTVEARVEKWTLKNLASEWINEFSGLKGGKEGKDLTKEALKSMEDDFAKIIAKYDDKFDSLWTAGVITREFLGEEDAERYKTEADSALNIVTDRLFVSFRDYSVRVFMPGKLIGTNGFIDSSRVLLWPVKSDFFMTEAYRMWAESKTTNTWAWVVTGLFLLFVVAGLIFRMIRK